MVAELEGLNCSTEQDFLAIGGKLAEFRQATGSISSEIEALNDLISGERGKLAFQALVDALERSEDAEKRTASIRGALRAIHESAEQVRKALAGFKGDVSTFSTLGVMTRIETVRLGSLGQGFGNLADEIKQMAGGIQSAVETALETTAQLAQPIESALQAFAALQARQSEGVSSVIGGVMSSLDAFRSRQQAAREVSARMADRYAAVADSVGELVFSIQFHDITRQQVEHVIDALGRVDSKDRNASVVLSLQSSQLAAAERKLVAPTERIEQSLRNIAGQVGDMAAESKSLAGLSEDGQNSFFPELERRCAEILESIRNYAEAEVAIQGPRSKLVRALSQMRAPIEEIRAVDIQMARMALNASIRAAHIGEQGNALGFLAGRMHELAGESRRRSAIIFEALGAMEGAAAQLASGEERFQVKDGALQTEMRTAIEELHSSSEDSVARITRINAMSAVLSKDLAATCGGFSAGRRFAETVCRSQAMLRQMAAELDPAPLASGTGPDLQNLNEFVSNYTMQAERDVHEVYVKPETGAPAEAVATLPSGGGTEELGDNVELF